MPKPKILILDDEVEFASALAERLMLRDYPARAEYRAEKAFDSIRQDPPDVVLLDLKMPGMNGIEFLRDLKRSWPRIEVIMLTGHGDPSYVDLATREGAFDYIMKPVDITELTAKIAGAMERRSQG